MDEHSQRLWYVTSVLEFVLEVLKILFPEVEIRSSILYERYCRSKNSFPGDMSPALGVVNSKDRQRLIQKYLTNPMDGMILLVEDLENDKDLA